MFIINKYYFLKKKFNKNKNYLKLLLINLQVNKYLKKLVFYNQQN